MKKAIIFGINVYKKASNGFRAAGFPLLVTGDCKFQPTCSEYAISAINKYGSYKGSLMSFKRILKCHPFSKGGVDLP